MSMVDSIGGLYIFRICKENMLIKRSKNEYSVRSMCFYCILISNYYRVEIMNNKIFSE